MTNAETPTPWHEQVGVMIAIDTPAQSGVDQDARHDSRRSRLKRRQPMPRRTRSHSPSRRSPKLRHTNGRLHEHPPESQSTQHSDNATVNEVRDRQTTHVATTVTRGTRPRQEIQSFPSAAVDTIDFPTRGDVRRSISCAVYDEAGLQDIERGTSSAPVRTPRRFKIFYRDEALRETCAKNTRRMIENAKLSRARETGSAAAAGGSCGTDVTALSNQQRLALKALKYRKLLDRMHEIDDARLNDPSFDVLECLGVQWCKV